MTTDITIGLEDKKVTELTFHTHTHYRTNKQEGFFNKKYWGSRENKFIPKELLLRYKSLYETYKDNTLSDNTKVYSTQLSELPSHKLKNYVEENKLNITYGRKWTEIDSVIIGYNFIKEYYGLNDAKKYLVVPTSYLRKNYKKYLHIEDGNHGKINTDYCLIGIDDYHKMINFDPSSQSLASQFPTVEGYTISPGHGNSKAFKQLDFFKVLPNHIESNNLDVIFDETLNNEVTKGTVLDEEMFSSLLNMIDSEDKENLNMVKEIIANSEYEASEPYLAYLINTHPKLRVVNGNDNYKFLLKKLNKYKLASRFDSPPIDEILSGLMRIEPKFAIQYAKCVTIHINHKLKREIIKEIILN
jgi:hypothetical protein